MTTVRRFIVYSFSTLMAVKRAVDRVRPCDREGAFVGGCQSGAAVDEVPFQVGFTQV